jgi:serine-type anaerobic sulfatase-maturating enzyme
MPAAPLAFHLMAKPTGAICNLDCEYCFFLSKEMLYPGSRFRMAADLQESYIRQLLAAHARAPEVIVAWQGGEPSMMGLDFFRRSIELERAYARPGQRVLNTIQTNGTLLDDNWGAFLRENDFLVGISIDGPRPLHDAYRVDKGGKPTYDRVIRGLDVLKRHNVDWNVLTTVHAVNGDHGRRVYSFLRDELGATFIQFIPIVERVTEQDLPLADAGWGDRARHQARDHVNQTRDHQPDRPLYTQDGNLVTRRSVGPSQYGRFLIDVFEEWVRRDIGAVYIQMFDTALASFHGEPGGMCVHAETCGLQLALEHTGDVYSCDHYVEPGYLLGNISERPLLELIVLPQQQQFGQAKRSTLPRYCLDCDVRFACNGGCPKDRFATTPDGEPGLHYLCASYKDFFHHVSEPMRAMSGLLRAGQPAAGLMARYAMADAKRGRNDPCSCGSGRKWKRCHGAPPARLP